MVNRKIMALGLLLATGFVGAEEVRAAYWGGPGKPPVIPLSAGAERAVHADTSVSHDLPKVAMAKVRALPEKIQEKYGIKPKHVERLTSAFELMREGMEIQALRDEERERLYNDIHNRFSLYFGPRVYDREFFVNSTRGFPEMIQARYGIRPEYVEELGNAFMVILESAEMQGVAGRDRELLYRELLSPVRPFFVLREEAGMMRDRKPLRR